MFSQKFSSTNYLVTHLLIDTKHMISNLTMQKCRKHHLKQVVRVNSTRMTHTDISVPRATMHWGEHKSLLWSFRQKPIRFKKTSDKPNCGIFCNIIGLYSKHIKAMKDKKRLKNCSRLKTTKEIRQLNTVCDLGLALGLYKEIIRTNGRFWMDL